MTGKTDRNIRKFVSKFL